VVFKVSDAARQEPVDSFSMAQEWVMSPGQGEGRSVALMRDGRFPVAKELLRALESGVGEAAAVAFAST
jgi:hypothetical protein